MTRYVARLKNDQTEILNEKELNEYLHFFGKNKKYL